MAKLGLLFMVVFCVVQLSLASRLPRETETESSTPTIDVEGVKQKVKDTITGIQDSLNQFLTQENFDKFVTGLKETGKQLQTLATEAGKSVSEKVDELTKSEEKKE